MKHISFNIPTSFVELKTQITSIINKKKEHNIQVLYDFFIDINSELQRDYWNKDISEYMRNSICHWHNIASNSLWNYFIKHIKEIK